MVDIDKIIEALKDGKVVAIKTDTVYGLICDAKNVDAVNKIYEIKSRERKKPLSIFVKGTFEIKKYIDTTNLNSNIMSLMNKYWPGALTIIFRKKDDTFNHLLNGKTGIGIRIPNDETLLEILNKIDFPLAQTSCNISGEDAYVDANEIKEKLGSKVDMIVDGGKVENNVASTVITVEANEPFILRLGDVKIDD